MKNSLRPLPLLKLFESNISVGPNMAEMNNTFEAERRNSRLKAGRVNIAIIPFSLLSERKRRGWFLAVTVPTEGWHVKATNGDGRLRRSKQ